MFIGWKVQLFKNFSNSEELERPFWNINNFESMAIEKYILQYGFFSEDDLKNANNPMREKKRRAEFEAQIDELFN